MWRRLTVINSINIFSLYYSNTTFALATYLQLRAVFLLEKLVYQANSLLSAAKRNLVPEATMTIVVHDFHAVYLSFFNSRAIGSRRT